MFWEVAARYSLGRRARAPLAKLKRAYVAQQAVDTLNTQGTHRTPDMLRRAARRPDIAYWPGVTHVPKRTNA